MGHHVLLCECDYDGDTTPTTLGVITIMIAPYVSNAYFPTGFMYTEHGSVIPQYSHIYATRNHIRTFIKLRIQIFSQVLCLHVLG